jgi:hypothetical protein
MLRRLTNGTILHQKYVKHYATNPFFGFITNGDLNINDDKINKLIRIAKFDVSVYIDDKMNISQFKKDMLEREKKTFSLVVGPKSHKTDIFYHLLPSVKKNQDVIRDSGSQLFCDKKYTEGIEKILMEMYKNLDAKDMYLHRYYWHKYKKEFIIGGFMTFMAICYLQKDNTEKKFIILVDVHTNPPEKKLENQTNQTNKTNQIVIEKPNKKLSKKMIAGITIIAIIIIYFFFPKITLFLTYLYNKFDGKDDNYNDNDNDNDKKINNTPSEISLNCQSESVDWDCYKKNPSPILENTDSIKTIAANIA